MRVLQINVVYGVGSTGKIVRDIHHEMMLHDIESYVAVPVKNEYTDADNVHTFSNKILSLMSALYRRALGRQFDGALIQTRRLIRYISSVHPDVVHLHCINGNNINIYKLYDFLAKKKIKTILTLHAEFPYTGGCGHAFDCERWKAGCGNCPYLRSQTGTYIDGTHHTWKKLSECYKKFEEKRFFFTAVSPWLLQRGAGSPMLSKFGNAVVLNGLDTDVFYKKTEDGYWRNRFSINSNTAIIAYVTARFNSESEDLKGGRFVAELAGMFSKMDVCFIVAANYGAPGELPPNVFFAGRVTNQEQLASLYNSAACTLITSKRETFSMCVAESLCCGTPVVGFYAGGPESIAIDGYCDFAAYGDTNALFEKINRMINADIDREYLSEIAKSRFSKKRMLEGYRDIYTGEW